MHDFTDDINIPVSTSTENIPQNDLRVEFDDFDDMRNAGEDAFVKANGAKIQVDLRRDENE